MKCAWKERLDKSFELTSLRTRFMMFIFLLFIMLIYASRGWKEPWSYGYFNYTTSWINGFIPRAFVGTVLQFFLGEMAWSNNFLTLLQYTLAWVFFLYLSYVIYRLICTDNNLSAAVILFVFFTSTFCMFYLAEIGFFDHILYLFVVAYTEICLRKNVKICLIWGGIFSAFTPIVLETGAFGMCPIIASIAAIRVVSEYHKITLRDSRNLCITFAPTVLVVLIQKMFTTSQVALDIYKETIRLQPYNSQDMEGLIELFRQPNLSNTSPKTWVFIEPSVVVYAVLLVVLVVLYLFFTRADTVVLAIYSICTIASGFVGYATIYFGTDFHRYYFMTVMSVFLISLYILRLPSKQKLKCWQGIMLVSIVILILPHIIGFRLWNWNQLYSEFWFMQFLN